MDVNIGDQKSLTFDGINDDWFYVGLSPYILAHSSSILGIYVFYSTRKFLFLYLKV